MVRLVAVLVLSLAFAATASAAGPTAHASKGCSLSLYQQRHAGATYLVELRVSGTTCSNGLKVEKAWQSCRRSTAGKTTCRKRVLGYSCKQAILGSSKSQYDARVTCTAGSKVVKFVYTQNR
jgi:hypothetical protein